MFRYASVLFCIACELTILAADKPTLEQIFPSGAVRGSTNDVMLLGKVEPWPPKAWCSETGLDFQFSTNKGKATLVISPEAKIGPSLVRLFNDEGPSDLRFFVVSDKSETDETEPNNHFAKPQTLTNLPLVVNGRLEKNGDVDSFIFPIRSGEWLDASLDSYTLLAKLDPVLRIVTTNGYQLAWNHDFSSLDPRLIWQAPYDMDLVLQVFGFAYPADSDIRLSGGPSAVYRLHLTVSDDAPELLTAKPNEQEPNNQLIDKPAFDIPLEVNGTICPRGDVDRFRFTATKDEQIEARIHAASIGSPLDPWIAIEDAKGSELKRNDDADNSRDSRLEWKAPEDGSYCLVVGSVTHQGNLDCRYRVALNRLAPDYRVTSNEDAIVVTPGATNTLKLTVKRLRGFTNELVATVKHLPEGVACETLALPAKDGEVSLSFVSATNAPAANGAFQVIVTDTQTRQERSVQFELVSRSENNGVPGGYSKLLIESTEQLWLTTKLPAPAETKK